MLKGLGLVVVWQHRRKKEQWEWGFEVGVGDDVSDVVNVGGGVVFLFGVLGWDPCCLGMDEKTWWV